MTEPRRCDSCKHWTPPSDRHDFRSPIETPWDDRSYDEREAEVNEADKLLGQCDGIPFCPEPKNLPTPPAAIMDGSRYFAQVYTGADFYCALWATVTTEETGR